MATPPLGVSAAGAAGPAVHFPVPGEYSQVSLCQDSPVWAGLPPNRTTWPVGGYAAAAESHRGTYPAGSDGAWSQTCGRLVAAEGRATTRREAVTKTASTAGAAGRRVWGAGLG